MKDCCKTGNEEDQNKSGFKKWFQYLVYVIIAIIILGAIWLQLSDKK